MELIDTLVITPRRSSVTVEEWNGMAEEERAEVHCPRCEFTWHLPAEVCGHVLLDEEIAVIHYRCYPSPDPQHVGVQAVFCAQREHVPSESLWACPYCLRQALEGHPKAMTEEAIADWERAEAEELAEEEESK